MFHSAFFHLAEGFDQKSFKKWRCTQVSTDVWGDSLSVSDSVTISARTLFCILASHPWSPTALAGCSRPLVPDLIGKKILVTFRKAVYYRDKFTSMATWMKTFIWLSQRWVRLDMLKQYLWSCLTSLKSGSFLVIPFSKRTSSTYVR